ncbi:MAG: METTL5 family protein [Candidatus Helarchaeota archaeon]
MVLITISKKKLQILLQGLKPHSVPDIKLEQYPLDANTTAEIIYIAGFLNNDIVDKKIIDLGCGNGQLGLAASLFGAKQVIGIEIDPAAIAVAKENQEILGVENIEFMLKDIHDIAITGDTVLQNPPFGVQVRGKDMEFLKKAFQIAPVIYSLHKRSIKNRQFIMQVIERASRSVRGIFELDFNIPHLYEFHAKKSKKVQADLWRITTSS